MHTAYPYITSLSPKQVDWSHLLQGSALLDHPPTLYWCLQQQGDRTISCLSVLDDASLIITTAPARPLRSPLEARSL